MFDTLKKALWIIKNRPLDFLATLRQYRLFFITRLFQSFIFPKNGNVTLRENVRLQSLSSLQCERPHALINIEKDSVIYEKAKIEAYGLGKIQIGEGCIIGDARISSRQSIELGSHVVTSWNVFIQDFDPHPIEPELRKIQMQNMVENFRPKYRENKQVLTLNWNFPCSPIQIGNNVWIGANVTILKGVKIGHDCVIATGSVVTAGVYPDRSVIAGVPAKVIKQL